MRRRAVEVAWSAERTGYQRSRADKNYTPSAANPRPERRFGDVNVSQ
jgi:hypothetical protein